MLTPTSQRSCRRCYAHTSMTKVSGLAGISAMFPIGFKSLFFLRDTYPHQLRLVPLVLSNVSPDHHVCHSNPRESFHILPTRRQSEPKAPLYASPKNLVIHPVVFVTLCPTSYLNFLPVLYPTCCIHTSDLEGCPLMAAVSL